MRALIQRVKSSSVSIEGKVHSSIENGFLILLGVCDDDTDEDIEWLSGKISKLRVFSDNKGLMNKSLDDTNGNVLIISQFTLFAQTKKGNRPSFIQAAKPEISEPVYESFCNKFETLIGKERVKRGVFGADMQVSLLNDGPVTIWIDTKNKE